MSDIARMSGEDVRVWWELFQYATSQTVNGEWADLDRQVGTLVQFVEDNIGEVGVEAMAGFIGGFDKAWQGTLLGYVEPVAGFAEAVMSKWGRGSEWDLVRTLAAGNPFLPQTCLQLMYDSSQSWDVKQILGANPNIPRNVAEKLCTDATHQWEHFSAQLDRDGGDAMAGMHVGESLATNTGVSVEVLREISRVFTNVKAGEVFLFGLALNPNSPADVVEEVSVCGTERVVQATIEHPNMPAHRLDELYMLFTDGRYVGTLAERGRNLSSDLCRRLMRIRDVHRVLAGNCWVRAEVLEELSWSGTPDVLVKLAGNPSVNDDVLLRVAASSDARVSAAITYRPIVPRRVLQAVIRNSSADSETLWVAGQRLTLGPGTSADSVFVAGLSAENEYAVAGWPGIPADTLAGIAISNKVWAGGVRWGSSADRALRNPGCPIETIREVAADWRGELGFPQMQKLLWERTRDTRTRTRRTCERKGNT